MLADFIELPGNAQTEQAQYIREQLVSLNFTSLVDHGTMTHSSEDFQKGMLVSPESFFLSRYSLREFKTECVDEDIIKRAVSLAMKTPSVCNRQAWHVYHSSDKEVKEKALKYQSGNRGFGEKIPNIMVLTVDLKAFVPASVPSLYLTRMSPQNFFNAAGPAVAITSSTYVAAASPFLFLSVQKAFSFSSCCYTVRSSHASRPWPNR